METSVILALDIGSSSVRCSAFSTSCSPQNDENGGGGGGDDDSSVAVKALPGMTASRTVQQVQPNTGKILHLFPDHDNGQPSLFDVIDHCVEETLECLRRRSAADVGGGRPFRIVGVGFSSFVMNLVGVNGLGVPVGEEASISYACNTAEVAKEVQSLQCELGPEKLEKLYRETGAPIHAAYALAQLRVFYDTRPELARSVTQWQSVASICLSRWLGLSSSSAGGGDGGVGSGGNGGDGAGAAESLPISYSEASWTGLLDYRRCSYHMEMLNLLPSAAIVALPDLADYCYPFGSGNKKSSSLTCSGIRPESVYGKKWPELCGVPLFLGLGDGVCANLGSKCGAAASATAAGGGRGAAVASHRIACTVGTSAAARVCLPLPITAVGRGADSSERTDDIIKHESLPINQESNNIEDNLTVPSGLFCYRVDQEHVLVGGALTDGGSVVQWATKFLNLSSPSDLEKCLQEVGVLLEEDYTAFNNSSSVSASSAAPALTVVPFLSGERSTGFRIGATGAVLGITRETTAAHFLKSSLEGVVLRLKAIIQLIQNVTEDQRKHGDGGSDCGAPSLIVSGKALEANGLWRQMLADCTGLPVVLDCDTQEGTSRGVAIMVAGALERIREKDANNPRNFLAKEEPIRSSIQSFPNIQGRGYWASAVHNQNKLIDALSPLYT